ncbi:MAG: int [Proteobacteria bacterium]|nr:int [Pseudomonadota bacterium]
MTPTAQSRSAQPARSIAAPSDPVADVLRHRSLETSRIYAKLDTPNLVEVALPWPGSKS